MSSQKSGFSRKSALSSKSSANRLSKTPSKVSLQPSGQSESLLSREQSASSFEASINNDDEDHDKPGSNEFRYDEKGLSQQEDSYIHPVADVSVTSANFSFNRKKLAALKASCLEDEAEAHYLQSKMDNKRSILGQYMLQKLDNTMSKSGKAKIKVSLDP